MAYMTGNAAGGNGPANEETEFQSPWHYPVSAGRSDAAASAA